MKFRPDIEGLRGVAVLLVVLAHAKAPGWSGGFIGVDVFFVISGFLITGLLATELRSDNKVAYWSFYARRAKRLAPALLLMLTLVSALCLNFLHGEVLRQQLASSQWAALWLSNVYFAFGQFDYFGSAAQDSLFLHTWSLGVEEQFYLLWPWLVVFFWRDGRVGIAWLVLMIAGSLAITVLLMSSEATGAYYLMPARLWQLAVGALVYRITESNSRLKLPACANTAGLGGLVMLVLSLVIIDETVPYPSLWALLPTLAAAGILIAGSGPGSFVSRLLESSILRLPGRISYSWYLWHWPFLIIGPALGLWPLGGLETLAMALLSFLAGWASFAAVEQPFRRSLPGSPRATVVASLSASVGLAASLCVAANLVELGTHPDQSLQQRVQALVTIPAVYANERCDQWYSSADLVPCEVEAGDGSAGLMVLLADSIGTQWLPALQYAASVRRMRLIVMTKSSCAIVDEPFVYARIHRRFTECELWREAAVAHVQSLRPELLILGSASTYDFSAEQWIKGTARLIDRLGQGKRSVVVLAPTPTLFFHGPGCVIDKGREASSGIEIDSTDCAADLGASENSKVIDALRQAADAGTNSHFVYLNDIVCSGGKCRAWKDGNLVFRDQQHLNASFVASLGAVVERRIPGAAAAPSNR